MGKFFEGQEKVFLKGLQQLKNINSSHYSYAFMLFYFQKVWITTYNYISICI